MIIHASVENGEHKSVGEKNNERSERKSAVPSGKRERNNEAKI